MLDAAAYFNFPAGMSHRTFLDHSSDSPTNPHASPVRPIAAADGWLVVSPVSRRQIRGACAAVGRPEWAEELLQRGIDGLSHALLERLEPVVATRTVQHWLAAFAAEDVPAAACLSADEHLADPQVRHNQLYSVTDTAAMGRVRNVRYPARYSSWPTLGQRAPAPALGEDPGES
jgi:crotonobetainyl-CoA:carnitine CoA-transferase CaiB-like acyl-CoA transferase